LLLDGYAIAVWLCHAANHVRKSRQVTVDKLAVTFKLTVWAALLF
jgi:hypothetical protein